MSAENSGNIESSPKETKETIPNPENPSQDMNSISSELKFKESTGAIQNLQMQTCSRGLMGIF